MNKPKTKRRGFSLVDVIVASALVLMVFVGISAAFKTVIDLSYHNKAKLSALSVMNEQMEFIRNLSYDNIGTVNGIPSGTIPQIEKVKLNGIDYTRRVLVQYVDSPADGLGVNDINGITADYKKVKVEVSWSYKGKTKNVFTVSNFVPKGIETITGGGTLVINVLNSLGIPVVGASVSIVNNSINPVVSVNTFTNTAGVVMFPGSPAGSSYEITVTKAGYSTAKTYNSSVSNPNPNPGNLSVIKGKTTASTFQIDLLSSKTIKTYDAVKSENWEDLFNDSSKISSLASTTVSSGSLKLTDNMGVYKNFGDVYSVSIKPQYLNKWQNIYWNSTLPSGTNIVYKVYYYDGVSSFVLVPDTDLPGNSVGFNTSSVDISGLSISKYSNIKLAGFLSTSDTSKTPILLDWKVTYLAGPTPLPNLAFNMIGNKTIGSDASGKPIYKYSQDLKTDGSGVLKINSLEWDTYNITVDSSAIGLDIGESCEPQPVSILPGVSVTTDLYFVPKTTNSLLVAVRNSAGNLLSGASIVLYRTGFSETQLSSSCGQSIFTGLQSGSVSGGNPYSVDLSLAGYTKTTISNIDISGTSKINVVINN